MAERLYVDDMRSVYNEGADDDDTVEADDEAEDDDKQETENATLKKSGRETKNKDEPIESEEKDGAKKAPKEDKGEKDKKEKQTKEKKKGPLGITTPKTKKKAGPRSDNSPNIRHYLVKKNKTENNETAMNETAMNKYRDSTNKVRSMVKPRVHMKNKNYEKGQNCLNAW